MIEVLNVVAPVFVLVGMGYIAVRLEAFPYKGVAGLIGFVNTFAAPCLLFRAMLTTDFGAAFDLRIIVPFYLGAAVVMLIGSVLAHQLFKRTPGEAVAVGFTATFSNTLLVGVPILQRAFGDAAMPVVFSIIGLHAPLLMTGGMLAMEIARRDGGKASTALLRGVRTALTNPLLIGILIGIAGNVLGLEQPEVIDDVTALLASTVMPVALFGLGGALTAYKLTEGFGIAATVAGLKLIIHPAIAWLIMVPLLRVDTEIARYGIVLAGMPSGINAYIFASLYGRSVDVASSAILISTVGALFTITLWLLILG